jgi:ClpP class serine protease
VDIKVGLSIYNSPWLIERQVGLNMFDHWLETRHIENAWSYNKARGQENEETAYQAYQKLFAKSTEVVVAPNNSWDLRQNFKGFDGASVAVIAIEGPLMKADFCGDLGTVSIGNLIKMANDTESVKTILLVIDSPGGTVSGTENLASVIRSSQKRTVSVVDGYMCSAAYWIGCSANEVYAASNTSIIGSIGTMISWYDNTAAMEEKGYVLREYYADASKDKNLSLRNASKGEGKLLIEELLNPLNDEFTSWVKASRPQLAGNEKETLSGKTFTAKKAIDLGLIDGMKSIETIISESPKRKNSNSYSMKVFQLALIAAAATEFSVTDQGFVLSEDQLNAIEGTLSENATEIASLKAKVKGFESAELAPEIATLTADLAKSIESISAKEAEIAALQADLATAKEAQKAAAFVAAAADGDDSDPGDEQKPDLSQSEHNKKAAAMGF